MINNAIEVNIENEQMRRCRTMMAREPDGLTAPATNVYLNLISKLYLLLFCQRMARVFSSCIRWVWCNWCPVRFPRKEIESAQFQYFDSKCVCLCVCLCWYGIVDDVGVHRVQTKTTRSNKRKFGKLQCWVGKLQQQYLWLHCWCVLYRDGIRM